MRSDMDEEQRDIKKEIDAFVALRIKKLNAVKEYWESRAKKMNEKLNSLEIEDDEK